MWSVHPADHVAEWSIVGVRPGFCSNQQDEGDHQDVQRSHRPKSISFRKNYRGEHWTLPILLLRPVLSRIHQTREPDLLNLPRRWRLTGCGLMTSC